MLNRSSTIQNIWLNRASHRTTAAIWRGCEKIRGYFGLAKVNNELAAQNETLMMILRAHSLEEERDAEIAADTLNVVRDPFKFIPAGIVRMSRNSTHNYIILNKGAADGVRTRCGVVTANGVVGVISAVSEHYSYGISLINSNFTVGAKIGREGFNAPLSWDGLSPKGAIMSDIPPHYEISPGDTVWTSGYSTMFPADIPIGLTEGSRSAHGSSQEVSVRLFEDIYSVRYVLICDNLDRDEMEDLLRKAGEQNMEAEL